jgi:hypothetical protein
MKKIVYGFLIALGLATSVAAQGDLSNQVLRLLTRNNYWSGTQTFASTVGVTLEQSGTEPLLTDDTLYNLGGNLYFNGVLVATSAGAGTVTSVDLTMPAIFSVSGNPVTGAGTLAVTLANANANLVLAGPTTGSPDVPAFRALVAADIPSLSSIYLTPAGSQAVSNKTGLISQWTNDSGYLTSSSTGSSSIVTVGTVTAGTWHATIIDPTYGGTGINNGSFTQTLAGNVVTAGAFTTSGAFALTLTTTGATNVTLPTTGTLVNSAVTTLSSLVSVGTITTGTWSATAVAANKGGTGQTVYAVGDLLYASTTTALSKLADVATTNVLISGGVGVAPSWGKVALASAVSGTLPVANGGTNLTTASNNQTIVSNGTTWLAKTLPDCQTGTLSFTASSNAFSCATSIIIGTGAPTPSVNNILFRSTTNQIAEFVLGNGSRYAQIAAYGITAGNALSIDFAGGITQHILDDAITPTANSSRDHLFMLMHIAPTVNQTSDVVGLNQVLYTDGSHNYSGGNYGLYGSSYTETTGTTAKVIGVAGDAESGSTNTVTWLQAVSAAFLGNYAAGTVTNEANFYAATPFNIGAGTVINHYGIYLEDQTLAGTTIDYAFFYAAPSSKEIIFKSDGQVLFKALMTTGSAGSKKVVCVDTATGQLYASTTGTDCSS